jgi:hypothetical protein
MSKTLETQTPVEIDSALAEIWERWYAADQRARLMKKDAVAIAKRIAHGGSNWDQDSLTRTEARAEELRATADAILAETEPFDAEFERRGGWTRAWKVTNAGGHVHRSMHCQTCFVTTEFAWLPQVSGMDESLIVELAASAACTVCYPSAPVDRPTTLWTRDEQAAKAEREARAAAKIERERKRLEKALLPDGSELRVSLGHYPSRISTLATARRELTDAIAWGYHDINGGDYPILIAAIAAKEGKNEATVIEEAEKRAAKRK